MSYTNPFAVVVMAHLKTKATQQNPQSRLEWKLSLVRSLYQQGYSRDDVVQLFRFIDWVMILPEELARGFKQVVRSYEEANKMRYVTSIEELAIEQGIVQTSRNYIIRFLQTRFGELPSSIVDLINGIKDAAVLQTIFTRAIAINSIAEFQQVLNEVVPGE
jgi:hypothetical protein